MDFDNHSILSINELRVTNSVNSMDNCRNINRISCYQCGVINYGNNFLHEEDNIGWMDCWIDFDSNLCANKFCAVS